MDTRSSSPLRFAIRAALLLGMVACSVAGAWAQLPRPGHIVLVVEESRNYADVFQNANMPYLNGLATQYGYANNYYAATHPAIGNYMMMTTGTTAVNDNSYTGTVSVDNLARQLMVLGKTWKSYAENLPSVGYTGGDRYPYVKYRNPFAYFTDVANSSSQRQNLVPFTQFATDLQNGNLPNFSMVLPNVQNDARDGLRSTADNWLKNNIGPLLANAQFQKDGVLIILFDQSLNDTTNGGGRVMMVVASPAFSKRGYVATAFYRNSNLLRTILEMFGGTVFPGNAALRVSMSDFFQPQAVTCPANPVNNTVTICAPVNNSTTSSSSVRVLARPYSTTPGTPVMQVYVDQVKTFETTTSLLDKTLTLAAGTHRITVQAVLGTTAFKSTVFTTVQTSTQPAPTATLTASSTSITAGQSSVLSWNTTNATGATLNGSAVATSGSQTVSPTSTTTYTLTATGAGGSVSTSVTITVGTATPAPTATLTANPASITQGASSTLSWSSTNATSATLNGAAVATSGTKVVNPAATTTYTLSVTGAGGTVSKNVTVTVSAPAPPPHSAAVSWTDPNTSGVTSYKTYRAPGTLDSSGNVASCGTLALLATVTAPTKTFTDNTVAAGTGYCYAITAVNSAGESPKSAMVKAKIPTP